MPTAFCVQNVNYSFKLYLNLFHVINIIPRLKCFTEVNTTCCPIMSDSELHLKTASRTRQEQILSGKQLEGSRLQSKWEFLSRKNNETVYFYCILNEKSIDAPCVPVALYLQHNNRTAANSRLIWKKKKESNLLTKMWTILSSQIIKVEWSCNCCLRKIISKLSSSQKTPIFDPLAV